MGGTHLRLTWTTLLKVQPIENAVTISCTASPNDMNIRSLPETFQATSPIHMTEAHEVEESRKHALVRVRDAMGR